MKSPFQIIEQTLYTQVSTLTDLGVPEDTIYRGLVGYQREQWQGDWSKKIVRYDTLAEQYKRLLWAKYGNEAQIKKIALWHGVFKARMDYREEDEKEIKRGAGRQLTLAEVNKAKDAAAVLAMLDNHEKGREWKWASVGYPSREELLSDLVEWIGSEGISLPKSRRLWFKLKDYRDFGASVCVSAKIGNQNSAKATPDANPWAVDVILNYYNDKRKFNKRQIWEQYQATVEYHSGEIQTYKGKECILRPLTYQCVAKLIKEHSMAEGVHRYGRKYMRNNKAAIIHGKEASLPFRLVWYDGWEGARFFENPFTGKPDKLNIIVMTDDYSGAFVGFAVDYTETSAGVFAATRNLVSRWGCFPEELRYDKGTSFQAGESKQLFNNVAKINFPSETGAARSKVVESRLRQLRERIVNYAYNSSKGNIVGSTLEHQMHPDTLKEIKQSGGLPSLEQVVKDIELDLEYFNNLPNAKGITPMQKLMSKIGLVQRKVESDEALSAFQVFRMKGKKLETYQYTPKGISMTLRGDTIHYQPDIDDHREAAKFLNTHTGITDFYVKYDPTDLEYIGLYLPAKGKEAKIENMLLVAYCKAVTKISRSTIDGAELGDRQLLYDLRLRMKAQLDLPLEERAEREQALSAAGSLHTITLERVQKDTVNAARRTLERNRLLQGDTEVPSKERKKYAEQTVEALEYNHPTNSTPDLDHFFK